MRESKVSPLMAYSVCGCTLLFAATYSRSFWNLLSVARLPSGATALMGFMRIIETTASFYAFAGIFSAAAYLLMRERISSDTESLEEFPPIGILYLCCGDLDLAALRSLCNVEYRGGVHLILHDDSRSLADQAEVNAAVAGLSIPNNYELTLLRRPDKSGGKPAAVNYVLEKTGHLYPYFLLCDNDSTIVDHLVINKVLRYFRDDRVAVVQCRSVSLKDAEPYFFNKLLCRSIDVFDLFLTVSSRFGWRMFIGHNAFLRTQAVQKVGGLTPGFCSDDLDLTIRLNLRGHTVVYAPEAEIGEKHPPDYQAFRRRTYKWSYGCMQMLKTHAWTVLTTSKLSFAEKVSFFYFTGFYAGQIVLLAYVSLMFLLGPFILRSALPSEMLLSLSIGTILLISIYVPTCAYFIRSGTLRREIWSVVCCGLVYGTIDFVCVKGIWDGLCGKRRRWIPTNARGEGSTTDVALREALFGIVLLVTPLFKFPALLYLPCAYVYAGKFLAGPAISVLYRDRDPALATRATERSEGAAA